MQRLRFERKWLFIVILIAIGGLFVWQCVRFKEANTSLTQIYSHITLPEVDFPENPQLKEQLYEMIADNRDDAHKNGIYFVGLDYDYDDALEINRNRIIAQLTWHRSTSFCYFDLKGYFTVNNATFIIGYSDIPLQIVSPGQSRKMFKSEPLIPLFGKNVGWGSEYIIESGKYSHIRTLRLEFNEKIAKEYADSIQRELDAKNDSLSIEIGKLLISDNDSLDDIE